MSADPDLPAGVARFLEESIESYEQLEILLLMHSQPGLWWGTGAFAAATQLSDEQINEALRALCQRGLADTLVGNVPMYKYGATALAQAAIIGELETCLVQRKVEVIKAMHQHALARLRARAAHTFTDAFLGSRKREEG